MHYKQEQYVSHFYQTGKSHFSADFQCQEEVCIIHECTLCNPNDSIFERFACFLGIFFKRVIEVEGGSCKTSMETEVFTATEFPYFIQIFG